MGGKKKPHIRSTEIPLAMGMPEPARIATCDECYPLCCRCGKHPNHHTYKKSDKELYCPTVGTIPEWYDKPLVHNATKLRRDTIKSGPRKSRGYVELE